MVETTTIVKALGTAIALPGLFMTLIGLGVVPVDESMGQIANIFIEPLNIPLKPFFCVLGPLKILGALSLWNIGPMPQWFGRIGLIISSVCGGYGHYTIGEPVFGAVAYIGLMGSLYYLDPITMTKGKKE